jgi:hypothetical protein
MMETVDCCRSCFYFVSYPEAAPEGQCAKRADMPDVTWDDSCHAHDNRHDNHVLVVRQCSWCHARSIFSLGWGTENYCPHCSRAPRGTLVVEVS